MSAAAENLHSQAISANAEHWQRKPLLRRLYRDFYRRISRHLIQPRDPETVTVELGSGLGHIKEVLPGCITTEMEPNENVDRVENAYGLSFADASVDNLVLLDTFHHLRYPGTALAELSRVLRPGGRIVIFEPCISWLGRLVYGKMHPEPIGWDEPIVATAPETFSADTDPYYAAQGNATRVFVKRQAPDVLPDTLEIVTVKRLAAVSYVASGGYSGPQLYPRLFLPVMRGFDAVLGLLPGAFATRVLVVLAKRVTAPPRSADASPPSVDS